MFDMIPHFGPETLWVFLAGMILPTLLMLGMAPLARRRLRKGLDHDAVFWRTIAETALDGADVSPRDLDARAACVLLRRGETLIAVRDGVTRFEVGPTGAFRRESVTTSTPPIGGVQGSAERGAETRKTGWRAVDRGRLVVTDRGVTFEGAAQSETIPWAAIADVKVAIDGHKACQVMRRDGLHQLFQAERADPEFGAVLYLAARRHLMDDEPLAAI